MNSCLSLRKSIVQMQRHILVIDDDSRLIDLLSQYLEQEGFLTSQAQETMMARRLLNLFSYDLILLDYMMPQEDGIQFLRYLRQRHDQTAVLMLTAKNQATDRIVAFESGADDYLGKNFDPRELILRIHNILKRRDHEQEIAIGSLRLCPKSHELWHGGRAVPLSASQKSLLFCLARASGEVVAREELRQLLHSDNNSRSVDTQLTRLRQRLATCDASLHSCIEAVRGRGYRLNLPS